MNNPNGSRPPSRDETPTKKESPTTKFRPTNQNIIRDVLILFIPIFVLYKLSTHPSINSIGYVDPNAPKKLSQEEVLSNIIKNMALNKYREKYRKRKQLLESVDPQKCYDFTSRIKAAEDTIVKSNMANSNKRAKKKQRPTIKRINKTHGKKKKMQFGRKRSSSSTGPKPSAPPMASSFLSDVMLAFKSASKPTMKGTENSNNDDAAKPREKTKKRKFSFKRS